MKFIWINSFVSLADYFCIFMYLCGGSINQLQGVLGTPLQYSCLENPMDGGVWSMGSVGSRRVRHDLATSLSLFTFMHWRRKWQPTPVFLPGESQGWGRTESDTTKVTQQQQYHVPSVVLSVLHALTYVSLNEVTIITSCADEVTEAQKG